MHKKIPLDHCTNTRQAGEKLHEATFKKLCLSINREITNMFHADGKLIISLDNSQHFLSVNLYDRVLVKKATCMVQSRRFALMIA